MRYSITGLRREAWRLLRDEVKEIRLIREEKGQVAHCWYDSDDGWMKIYVDNYETDILKAVAHELLHRILDSHFEKFSTANISENFITSLEKPFFNKMTRRQKTSWRQAIKLKLKRGTS